MVPTSMMFRAASAVTAVGIVLAVANWYARPEAALAWTATLAMFAVMIAMCFMPSKQPEMIASSACLGVIVVALFIKRGMQKA